MAPVRRPADAGSKDAGRADDGPPIAPDIVDQAVDWYVRFAAQRANQSDQARFDRWLAADEDHARVWRRLQDIGNQVRGVRGQLSTDVARSTLVRASDNLSRRRSLKTLVQLGACAGLLYLVQRELSWQAGMASLLADVRTATGERRRLDLPDGTRLVLNTATAVDLRFEPDSRLIVLHAGEILVTTGGSPGPSPVVRTVEGTLLPLGTQFMVRRDPVLLGRTASTELTVTEGSVAIVPAMATEADAVRVEAGQTARFSRDRVASRQSAASAAPAWVDGFLTAERMPLDAFLVELARYRPGRLAAAPGLETLQVTGVWPLDAPSGEDATDRILASLERQLPVRVIRRSRYWVIVERH